MVNESQQTYQETNQEQVGNPSVIESSPAPAPAPSSSTTEKMLSQSHVNSMLGAVRKEGYEKGRKEALAEREQNAQTNYSENDYQQNNNYETIFREKAQAILREEAEKEIRLRQAHEILNTFSSKVSSAKQRYSDFDTQVSKLNLEENSHLIQMTHTLDNPGEVLYELATNTQKFALINMLVASRAPSAAIEELQKLSTSIKQNQEALKQQSKKAEAPLGRLNPSITGVDNDQFNLQDLKKRPWARS
jgi:hypothetical protein